MVETISNADHYIGLSTDSKPTGVPVGSTFWESDTDDTYRYSAAGWTATTERGS